MKPLTIVHVLRAPMGGVMRHVRDLALLHTAQGHHVGIICDSAGTVGYNEALLSELDGQLALGVHRFNMHRAVGLSDFMVIQKISALINALTPDIIHGHGAKGGVYARICGDKGPSRLYSPHGGSLHYDPAKLSGKIYFTAERALEKRTDKILFVADFERRTYEQKIGALSCPWAVCYNGLGPEEFEPVQSAGVAADFLFIGEMRALKGPDLFIDCIKRLHVDGHSTITGIMVGAGPDKDALKARVKNAGLDHAISLRDPMPARQAFGLANTIVLPSRAEAMPYIVIEALAAHKPVVTTNVGGIGEIFGDKSAVLATPQLDDIYGAMKHAHENPAKFCLSMPSIDVLKARFSADVMAASVLHAYEGCIGQ